MSHSIYVYQIALLVLICGISLSFHFIKLFKGKINKILAFMTFLSFFIILMEIILAGSEDIRKQNGDIIGIFLTDVMFYNYIFNPVSLSVIGIAGVVSLFVMVILKIIKHKP